MSRRRLAAGRPLQGASEALQWAQPVVDSCRWICSGWQQLVIFRGEQQLEQGSKQSSTGSSEATTLHTA